MALQSWSATAPSSTLSGHRAALIEGYASLFRVADASGDIARAGAFARSLRAGPVPMLLQHKAGAIVGRWSRMVEDGRGLFVRGLIESPAAQDLVQSGGIDGLSIGFRPRLWGSRSPSGRLLADIELVIIDGPPLTVPGTSAPWLAVSGDPWAASARIYAGPDETALTERAVAAAPSSIGQLLSPITVRPLGRWDKASFLDIELFGGDLSSLSAIAVLNGANRLFIQTVSGWELLSFREAELIGTDQWRLSGLLRGLNGSTSSEALAGAVVVLVDDNLVQADFFKGEVGLSLKWSVDEAASREFVYTDASGLPWNVGHLRASEEAGGWNVSWVRRGADISDSWALPETDNTGTFLCQVFSSGVLITSEEVSEAALFVANGADEIRVSEVGQDGRVGNWVSIPLIAA